ncbi:hypothetical protein ACFPM0_28020 [Pseudonocardia sulfidoxydans]|uniref:hypothetical protein n=1 Tax=Pseudonocardia sulfidoxydans TaxID=54011 RepID=UPI00361FFAAC
MSVDGDGRCSALPLDRSGLHISTAALTVKGAARRYATDFVRPRQPHVNLGVGRSRRWSVLPSSAVSRPVPFGWPSASLDTACGRLERAAIRKRRRCWSRAGSGARQRVRRYRAD